MFAVIRVKGELHLPKDKKRTMELLRLFRANHLVLVKEKPEMKKMLKSVETIITFGELDEKTLELLLEKRGRILGDKPVDADFLKKNKIVSIKEVAKTVLEGKKTLREFGIKSVFRLHAPRKGFERAGIKKSYSVGGVWGYRAQDINCLIKKMA